jgi:hypothetical protein
MPAMRKKERKGPGIATVVDSLDPISVFSADEESEGVAPRGAAPKLEPTQKTAARRTAGHTKELVNRFIGKSIKRKVRALMIPPRNGVKLNGTVEMRGKKIWTQTKPNSKEAV